MWAHQGMILGPPDYESGALTNWAIGPKTTVAVFKNFLPSNTKKVLNSASGGSYRPQPFGWGGKNNEISLSDHYEISIQFLIVDLILFILKNLCKQMTSPIITHEDLMRVHLFANCHPLIPVRIIISQIRFSFLTITRRQKLAPMWPEYQSRIVQLIP